MLSGVVAVARLSIEAGLDARKNAAILIFAEKPFKCFFSPLLLIGDLR
jgi:hypothetical protein